MPSKKTRQTAASFTVVFLILASWQPLGWCEQAPLTKPALSAVQPVTPVNSNGNIPLPPSRPVPSPENGLVPPGPLTKTVAVKTISPSEQARLDIVAQAKTIIANLRTLVGQDNQVSSNAAAVARAQEKSLEAQGRPLRPIYTNATKIDALIQTAVSNAPSGIDLSGELQQSQDLLAVLSAPYNDLTALLKSYRDEKNSYLIHISDNNAALDQAVKLLRTIVNTRDLQTAADALTQLQAQASQLPLPQPPQVVRMSSIVDYAQIAADMKIQSEQMGTLLQSIDKQIRAYVVNIVQKDFLAKNPNAVIGSVQTRKMTWSDSCLALPKSGEMCSQAMTPGYRIAIMAKTKTNIGMVSIYAVYHTDLQGINIREENIASIN